MFSKKIIGLAGSTISVGSFLFYKLNNNSNQEKTFSYEDVAKHNKHNNVSTIILFCSLIVDVFIYNV